MELNHWIAGVEVNPFGGDYIESLNPASLEVVGRVARGGTEDVAQAVSAAAGAARAWRDISTWERSRLLNAIAARLRQDVEHLADLECLETAKPRATAIAEIHGAADYFEFYAGLVHVPVGETIDLGPRYHSYTRREPYGVVGVITPWNVPINQAARAGAPALAAGNTVVMKPSEFTSATTVALARIATEVGIPPGVFNVVLGAGTEAGQALVEHPEVRKVAFTGSIAAGRAIGHIAAEKIMPLTLELGGKSASIIFADADLEEAARGIVRGFTTNAGQVCSASTRLLVEDSVFERVLALVASLASQIELGADMGPLTTPAQHAKVQEMVSEASADGALTIVGESSIDAAGYFVPPTILAGVSPHSRVAQEEIFGPVLVVMPFSTEAEAVRLANDTEYGLVAGVWTTDLGRGLRMADELEAGQVFVNTWTTGAVQTPFGGVKKSGYGREKGLEALHHYSQLKSVTVSKT